MCLRCGISADDLEKSYDGRTIEAGMREMDMPLKQLLIECMKLDGIPYGRGFDNETIRAAFSSVSLPGILSNVANKKLLKSFEAQPIIATKLCSTGDLNDFKENDRFRLTDVGDLLPVGADGEIKDGGVTEEAAKNQLETYGKRFVLTRKMIINDDLGAFMKVPMAMGNRAARLIDQLFFSRLLKNPVQLGRSQESAHRRNERTVFRQSEESHPAVFGSGRCGRSAGQRRTEVPARPDRPQAPRHRAHPRCDPHHRWRRRQRRSSCPEHPRG